MAPHRRGVNAIAADMALLMSPAAYRLRRAQDGLGAAPGVVGLEGRREEAGSQPCRSPCSAATVFTCPPLKRPTAQDAAIVGQILLNGVANDVGLIEILGYLAPLHPPNDTFPGEILLRLRADALDWAGVDRAHPVDLERLHERFLPEVDLRGRDQRKLQFAVLAVAAHHGGAEVDLLDEVAWWQTDAFWRYAAHAAVAYIRAVADRAGVSASEVCRSLAQE